jgi:hypothetical protein
VSALQAKVFKPLSNFGFDFNLRHYTKEEAARVKAAQKEAAAAKRAAVALASKQKVAAKAGAYTRPLLSST